MVVGGGAWGTAFTQLLGDREPRRDARGIAGAEPDRRTRAPTDGRGAASLIAQVPNVDATLAVPSVLGQVRGGRRPSLSLRQGPRPRDRASGSRRSSTTGRWRCSPARTWRRRSLAGLPGATVIASRGRVARGSELQDAINVASPSGCYVNTDLIGVELCGGGEERDCAVGGRRRRAAARRQRQGGADHARSRRDGAAGGGMRRASRRRSAGLAGMGDLIVHLLAARTGRNRRAGELIARGATSRRGASRRSARSSKGLTTAPVLRDLSHRHRRSSCRSPRGSVPRARRDDSLDELLASLMGRRATAE